jgi:hypothetical protein
MLQKACYPRVIFQDPVDNCTMPERPQSSLKLLNIRLDDCSVETIYESPNNPRLMTSFYFLLLPVVYDVLYYAFSQDFSKIGQIANQHEKVDNQRVTHQH